MDNKNLIAVIDSPVFEQNMGSQATLVTLQPLIKLKKEK